MTMHNAKGLEFPVVYITGLEDGLFPLARAYDDPPLLEEERRLFYVGITRAQQTLVLTYAEERRRNGELTSSRQSSFLSQIPKPMIDERSTVKARSTGRAVLSSMFGQRDARWSRPGGGASHASADDDSFFDTPRAAARRAGTPVQRRVEAEDESQVASAISVGSRVSHRKFGSGTVRGLAGHGRELRVMVEFDDTEIGTKQLLVAYAGLERDWESA